MEPAERRKPSGMAVVVMRPPMTIEEMTDVELVAFCECLWNRVTNAPAPPKKRNDSDIVR